MKKIILFLIILISLTGCQKEQKIIEELTANDIFNKYTNNIVEVKSTSENFTSFGTAIAIDNEKIITNAHVVTYINLGQTIKFNEYSIRFMDSDDYTQVELIKFDIDKDLAVLKLKEEKTIQSIEYGNTDKLNFGDDVFAIGNGSNHGIGISKGIISIPLIDVIHEEVLRTVIESNITITSGNSGGALINNKGELIGMTSFRLKDNSLNIIYGKAYSITIEDILKYI